MRIKGLLMGLVFCGAVFAQEPTFVTKIVRVHGDPLTLKDLACNGSNTNCQMSAALKAIVVKGRESEVERTEKAIQELDSISPVAASSSANKNVELTVYVIGGSSQPFVGAQDVNGDGLAAVVKQLRAIFPYSHYQLLSTMIIRSSLSGRAESSGMMGVRLNPDVSTQPSMYNIVYDSAKASGDSAGSLHLANFRFNWQGAVRKRLAQFFSG